MIANPKAKLLDPLPSVHAAIFGPIRPGVKSILQGLQESHRGGDNFSNFDGQVQPRMDSAIRCAPADGEVLVCFFIGRVK